MSERSVQEVVQALGEETISAPIISSVCQFPFFAVCLDETTDVSVKKDLIIYIRYICTEEIKKPSFIRVLELSDGTAIHAQDSVCISTTSSLPNLIHTL